MLGLKITIIGAGNVGWHLAQSLHKNGHSIKQIYSRNIANAQTLATKVNAKAENDLNNINTSVDLIIICVSDSALSAITSKLNVHKTLIAHTAGSLPLAALGQFENHGVFYPLQTFSKNSKININNTPFCIEASSNKNKIILLNLAKSLSKAVYELNSEQRLQCHLAAVFANNFANHMFVVAEQLLEENKLPFNLLKPLILETANKIQHTHPTDAQTGPASRNDKNTIEKHLKLLPSPELEKIYSFVSKSIWETKKTKNSKDE